VCQEKQSPTPSYAPISIRSKETSFGKAGDAIADDDVVEHADVDQSQGLAQPLGNANIRLAGLAYAGGVVVGPRAPV